jgi:glutaredoxin
MLRDAGIQYDELVLNRDYSEVTLRAVAGRSMVPQVFVNGEHIGVRTMSPPLIATGTAT